MAALKYWVWLSSLPNVDAKTVSMLIEHFGSPQQVFLAQKDDYKNVDGLSARAVESLCNKNLFKAVNALDQCAKNGWNIVTVKDVAYPERLKNIYDPPALLYVRGQLPIVDDEVAVAVVGTRNCTPYGLKVAERIGYDLARSGCVLVTGMARGIDGAAAKGALRGGGKVIGVLGCGLDVVYPAENKRLLDDVATVGALITEFIPGTRPEGHNFPIRNRIISGLSLGVTVIEAPKGSGAIITATHALEQGRDVFVVPGNIDSPASYGSNQLLREGAIAVLSGRDIVCEYEHMYPDKINLEKSSKKTKLPVKRANKQVKEQADSEKTEKKVIDKDEHGEYIVNKQLPDNLSEEEKAICAVLSGKTLHIDDIIQQCGLNANDVLSALTMLEISGIVRQQVGKYFTLN